MRILSLTVLYELCFLLNKKSKCLNNTHKRNKELNGESQTFPTPLQLCKWDKVKKSGMIILTWIDSSHSLSKILQHHHLRKCQLHGYDRKTQLSSLKWMTNLLQAYIHHRPCVKQPYKLLCWITEFSFKDKFKCNFSAANMWQPTNLTQLPKLVWTVQPNAEYHTNLESSTAFEMVSKKGPTLRFFLSGKLVSYLLNTLWSQKQHTIFVWFSLAIFLQSLKVKKENLQSTTFIHGWCLCDLELRARLLCK